MFLCDECTDGRSFRRSRGRCEGCGETADCNDLPADCYLPRVEQAPPRSPTDALVNDVERRSWEEFRESSLLWVANTVLHWFGWSIVVVTDDSDPDKVIDAYPVRTKWRGFSPEANERGVKRLTEWIVSAGAALRADIEDGEG